MQGTILVIEDDPVILEMLEEFLELLNLTHLSARDGDEARKILSANCNEIRVIICDVMLGRKNGPDIIWEFRQQCKGVPVIFTSGYANKEILHKGRPEHESSFFLKKPFTLENLKKVLQKSLEISEVSQ